MVRPAVVSVAALVLGHDPRSGGGRSRRGPIRTSVVHHDDFAQEPGGQVADDLPNGVFFVERRNDRLDPQSSAVLR